MDKIQSFQEYMTTQSVDLSITSYLINIGLATFLALLLEKLYVNYGRSLSNKKYLANNFYFITLTTLFIIAVVKSSLALSLGLVGALSIVRFRSAIKEPEELAFLFLCIAIGLGLGAGQRVITLASFTVIAILIITKHIFWKKNDCTNLLFIVGSRAIEKINLKAVEKILLQYCKRVDLRRLDKEDAHIELTFSIEFIDKNGFDETLHRLTILDNEVHITFMDHKANV